MTHIVAGQKVRKGDLSIGEMIARGNRLTDSTAASAAQGVLRIDNIPIIADRSYTVMTNALLMIATVANDSGTVRISYVENGTAATTDSTITGYNSKTNLIVSANANGVGPLVGRITAVSSGTMSVLLWTQRMTGTGTVRLSSAFGGIQIMVYDGGSEPGDTGIDI